MTFLKPLGDFVTRLELRSTGKWFFLSSLIGLVAGLAAIAFQYLGQVIVHITLVRFAGFHPGEPVGEHNLFTTATAHGEFHLGMVVCVMTLGGLFSGWLVYTFAPEAEGHGTDAAIDSFHNKRGVIKSRIPIIKTLASAITLGTGGSGGREGPIAQIGAGFGSFLATQLELSPRDRRIMLAAGMGAGVGAIFRAPLAGALFAGEILYRDADLESDVIVPSAISSIVAYSVYALSLPAEKWFTPLFGQDLAYQVGSPFELLPLAALAFILVLVAIFYIRVFYGVHWIFGKVPIKPHFKPAIGACLAGVVAMGLYQSTGQDRHALAVLSTGYGTLQEALTIGSGLSIPLLLLIAFFKVITTSLTISSGGSGGVFGPSMVIGGCVGAAIGKWFDLLWPDLVSQPEVYTIVGMAGFFAGAAHAPFSTIIMVSEMTGSYSLLLPTMWVSMLCFLLCRRWTLYDKQVPTRLESPAHRGDFIVDLLEGIKVSEVYQKNGKPMYIPESMTLDDIVHALPRTNQHYFPVVDTENRMVGIFSDNDVRKYLYDETIWKIANARDLMITDFLMVTPEDDLNTALQRFTALNLDELPVMDPQEKGKLLGMLRRKEAIAFYNRRLMEHKQATQEQS